jgi:hypothetical protein
MKLYDPVTSLPLTLYSSRGESTECWRAEEESVVMAVHYHYKVSKAEAQLMLENSDIDSPVMVNDEAYWVE